MVLGKEPQTELGWLIDTLLSGRMRRTTWGSKEKLRDRAGTLPDFRVRKIAKFFSTK